MLTFPTGASTEIGSELFAEFCRRIQREFCTHSAIGLDLFRHTVSVVRDVETGLGNEAIYPIHEALNWNLVRFAQQSRENLYAALLLNEDGSTWQAKLSRPRLDSNKTRKCLEQLLRRRVDLKDVQALAKLHPSCSIYQKYETAAGNGSRAYLPAVDFATRCKIAERYGLEPPSMVESFWEWVIAHPQVEIALTEGGKKSLSLLSQGYVAIALYGVNGGYRKHFGNLRELIADLVPFAVENRSFLLAFDQDQSARTRRKVAIAQFRLGLVLQEKLSVVRVATWNAQQGKGVDDLIVQSGVRAWQNAAGSAMTLSHWQLNQRLEQRLTHKPDLQVETLDMSQADIELPETGLIGIVGAKGTGKTKMLATAVKEHDKVLSAGHRIALQKQLCERLRLDYIGDLDKAHGRFITGGAYTMRLGLCVDSLLAIDPAQFTGCDLIGDEWTQVVRHLLTSATCAKDGRRPALLAIFKALIRVARRVIVADADLDDDSLRYLQDLKGDNSPVFLVQNVYSSTGYSARFIDSPDRSAIVSELIESVASLEPGSAEFVATDSKALSKTLAQIIQQQDSTVRLLVLNSETIGGDEESRFNLTPDDWLREAMRQGERLVVIASPTLATGASIEQSGIFRHVWGVFMGVSSTDSDLSQALSRVRESVKRIIWCTRCGTNFSAIGRSTNSQELKRLLRSKTNATVRLIRSGLSEDIAGAVNDYDWERDPHVRLYCQIAAEQNRSMAALRDALLVRLRYEGNQVEVETPQANEATKMLLRQARSELRELDAEKVVTARILSLPERLSLDTVETLDEADLLAVRRFDICDFLVIEPTDLAAELVLLDREGRRRAELLSLENQQHPGLSIDRSIKALEKQAVWNQGFCPWDIPNAELRRVLRESIGLNDLLDLQKEWTKYDLAKYATKARALAAEVKSALNFSITDAVRDTQILHQMLSQLGVKVQFRWSCKVEGHEGEKLRVYSLEQESWQAAQQILQRREAKRRRYTDEEPANSSVVGSPPRFYSTNLAGDPVETAAGQLCVAAISNSQSALPLWQSWPPSLQVAVLHRIDQSDQGMLDMLSKIIPELFITPTDTNLYTD